MALCPKCGKDFLGQDLLAEAFQARQPKSRKKLGRYIMFSCPHCKVFLDIKEKLG